MRHRRVVDAADRIRPRRHLLVGVQAWSPRGEPSLVPDGDGPLPEPPVLCEVAAVAGHGPVIALEVCAIPLELRPLIGDRIFGCDDCLDACPWNRFAQASRESAFAAGPSTTNFALRDYLKLNDAEFRNLFRNSPIKRIKRRGFLRNVCVALGNVGTPQDLPALEQAARDPEPLIAEHATWAIDRIRKRTTIAHSGRHKDS